MKFSGVRSPLSCTGGGITYPLFPSNETRLEAEKLVITFITNL